MIVDADVLECQHIVCDGMVREVEDHEETEKARENYKMPKLLQHTQPWW